MAFDFKKEYKEFLPAQGKTPGGNRSPLQKMATKTTSRMLACIMKSIFPMREKPRQKS